MPAKADRIGDLYIAEKGNVDRMAEKKIGEIREELKAVDDETLIFSANQALLAARAGATYVSPFLGRLDDTEQVDRTIWKMESVNCKT